MAEVRVALTATITHANGTVSVVGHEAATLCGDNPIYLGNNVVHQAAAVTEHVRRQIVAVYGDTPVRPDVPV